MNSNQQAGFGVSLNPGKYVLAVSGGVDSMVLLDVLRQQKGLELVIAHFDHGIRSDSAQDRRLVAEVARANNLSFVYAEGKLGAEASEATARQARYDFLYKTLQQVKARAIITAHHQDDVLETAIINLLRGTGRKGLSSLANQASLKRPLLKISKQQLLQYARQRQLIWREDSTNNDPRYLRNYVRLQILTKFNVADRKRLLAIIDQAVLVNEQLDKLLHQYAVQSKLERAWFNSLPHNLAREVLASWLRTHQIANFTKQGLERLVIGAKLGAAGQKLDVIQNWTLQIEKEYLALEHIER